MSLNDPLASSKVIGALLVNNELIEDDQFPLNNDYFDNKLELICFSCMYNIYQNGIRNITNEHIVNYLSKYIDQFEYFKSQNGELFLDKCKNHADNINYQYYYYRLKKFALLRFFKNNGFDVSGIYNEFEENTSIKEKMEERFDSADPEEIVVYFEKIITDIESNFETGSGLKGAHAGHDLNDLYDSFKDSPEMGLGLNGSMLNTIARGARLRKLYIRSAGTGVGKTRTLAASAAQLAVGTYYDIYKEQWITTNEPQPSLYITSEQEYEEIQTIVLAFVSGVGEDKILDRKETPEENERIQKAIKLIANSGLYIEPIGDYGIRALVNLIKRHKQTRKILYVFHDYIHSSMALLNEISAEVKISNLREDQMLLMLVTSLKNLCNNLNIFIFSATQLNRSYKTEEKMDATVIRGALSVGDKADYCSIMLDVEKDDLELIKTLISSNQLSTLPNVVTHIFKNRRNKYVNMKLYSYLDKSTGQMLDLFGLSYNNTIIEIEPIQILQEK